MAKRKNKVLEQAVTHDPEVMPVTEGVNLDPTKDFDELLAKSYKVGVHEKGAPKASETTEDGWTFNAQRWPTEKQAKEAGSDLYSRWMGIDAFKVFPSDDVPNKPMEG